MVSEQHTTPEMRKALRARYTPEPVPRCPVCGGAMANDDDSGNLMPDRETWWRCPLHPGRRDATAPLSDGDPDLLALLDDADALAGALAEVRRLRAALASIGARVNRWYWDDLDASALEAIDDVERIARAALAPQSDQAS